MYNDIYTYACKLGNYMQDDDGGIDEEYDDAWVQVYHYANP